MPQLAPCSPIFRSNYYISCSLIFKPKEAWLETEELTPVLLSFTLFSAVSSLVSSLSLWSGLQYYFSLVSQTINWLDELTLILKGIFSPQLDLLLTRCNDSLNCISRKNKTWKLFYFSTSWLTNRLFTYCASCS
jgi:hypothetical protein